MRIKFLSSYADEHEGFKAHNEYDFVDMRKANYFIDHGLAVPVESVIEKLPTKVKANANLSSDHKSK